jgi:acyl carrier protein
VGTEFVAPGNPLEAQLAAIWKEILGCDQVGIHDNFFEMGGHSILIIRLISRVRDAFDIELPIRVLFDSPTVAELALKIDKNPHAQPKLNTSAMLLEKVNQLSDSEVTKLLATVRNRQPAAQDVPGGGAGAQGSGLAARESGAEKPDSRGRSPSRKTAGHAPQASIIGPVRSVSGPDTREARAAEITTVAIPTRNRPGSLRECLVSFLENSRRYARTNEFVIVDDSPDLEARANCRQMLKSLRCEYGLGILYAGIQEKIQFARRLIAVGGFRRDIVEFALFDSERVSYALGANRNAISLHTAGEALLSTDDDTRCRVVAAPEVTGRIQTTLDPSPEKLVCWLSGWFENSANLSVSGRRWWRPRGFFEAGVAVWQCLFRICDAQSMMWQAMDSPAANSIHLTPGRRALFLLPKESQQGEIKRVRKCFRRTNRRPS